MKVGDGAKVFIKNKKINKFLLVLRDDKPTIPNPNCWSLFGGAIEDGETPRQTLDRELKEELNIKIYDIKELDVLKVPLVVAGESYTVKGYLSKAFTDANIEDVFIGEGQRAKYFSIEEIKKLKNLSSGALSLIDNYQDILNSKNI